MQLELPFRQLGLQWTIRAKPVSPAKFPEKTLRQSRASRFCASKEGGDKGLQSALAALDALLPTPNPVAEDTTSENAEETALSAQDVGHESEAAKRSSGVVSTSASISTEQADAEPSLNLKDWRNLDKKALLSFAWTKGNLWLRDQVKPASIVEEDEYLPRAQPRFAYIILAANLLVYIIGLSRLFTEGPQGPMDYFLQFAEVNEAVEAGEYYRIITANFLHDSFIHLCVSSYALLTIAPEAEAVLGSFAFLTTYILGGVAGTGLCFLLTDTLTVGASSGIFGLIGAMGAFLYKNHKAPKSSEGLLFAVGLLAFNLFLANDHATTVDNLGHLGAMVCGIYLGVLLSPAVVETPATPEIDSSDLGTDAERDKLAATNPPLNRPLPPLASAGGGIKGDEGAQATKVSVIQPNRLQSLVVLACVSITLASSIAVTVLHRTGELPYPKWF